MATWSFCVFVIFVANLRVPVNRAEGSTKTHIFATKITNFSEIYVFCDEFSDNFCVSQTQKEFWERSIYGSHPLHWVQHISKLIFSSPAKTNLSK